MQMYGPNMVNVTVTFFPHNCREISALARDLRHVAHLDVWIIGVLLRVVLVVLLAIVEDMERHNLHHDLLREDMTSLYSVQHRSL
jgi:hypothetical protein